jgi:Rrf2 family protein
MRISAKGEYAIKAMLDLALHHGKGLIPIQDIAARQGIPQRYLEQVLLLLKRAGFLQSKRGSAGGYQLSRPPQDISVGAVLSAMEGSLERSGAGQRAGRRSASDHARDLEDLWSEISAAVAGVVDRVSFADLCRRVEQRQSAARPMYHI